MGLILTCYVPSLTDFRCRGAIDATDVTQTQLFVERRSSRRRDRKKGRYPIAGACARTIGWRFFGKRKDAASPFDAAPNVRVRRAAGPNHWPKERSAVKPNSPAHMSGLCNEKQDAQKNRCTPLRWDAPLLSAGQGVAYFCSFRMRMAISRIFVSSRVTTPPSGPGS